MAATRAEPDGCWNCFSWSNAGNPAKSHGDCESEETYERKTPSYHKCPFWKSIRKALADRAMVSNDRG